MKTTNTILFLVALSFTAEAASNQVVRFDGSGDFITVPSAADLMPEDEITIEAWIEPLANANNFNPHFLSKGDGGSVSSSRSYELRWAAGGNSDTGIGVGVEFSLFLDSSTWAVLGARARYSEW